MLHAKTAVADCRWARVGSTNLNIASWIGNWELDVAVEDDSFGQAMHEMYLEDLKHASEIVLQPPRRMHLVGQPTRRSRGSERAHGSGSRAAAGAIGIGSMIGAAITSHRVLGPAEARLTGIAGVTLLLVAMLALLWPRVIVVPLAAIGGWVAFALLVRAWRLWHGPRRRAPRPGSGHD